LYVVLHLEIKILIVEYLAYMRKIFCTILYSARERSTTLTCWRQCCSRVRVKIQ